ncbi:MAG: hypothetical protein KBC39_03365 [Thermotogae bacterium]|jgi:hypothetical protein|nr:hypothetical protein [Thermotogota bacterium]
MLYLLVILPIYVFSLFWDLLLSNHWLLSPLALALGAALARKTPYWIVFLTACAFVWVAPLAYGINLWLSPIFLLLFYLTYWSIRYFERKNLVFFTAFAVFYIGQKSASFLRWEISDIVPFLFCCGMMGIRMVDERRKHRNYKSSLSYTGRFEP